MGGLGGLNEYLVFRLLFVYVWKYDGSIGEEGRAKVKIEGCKRLGILGNLEKMMKMNEEFNKLESKMRKSEEVKKKQKKNKGIIQLNSRK